MSDKSKSAEHLKAHRFPKGKSGNPGGPPKGIITKVREEFGDDIVPMLRVLRDLAMGETPKGYDGTKDSDRIKAAAEVMDRVMGKAPQSIEGEINVGASPQQMALLAALQLTPEERRAKLATLEEEDARALAEGPPPSPSDPSVDGD